MIMKLLIGAGADVNHSHRHETTLMQVALAGHSERTQMLLQAGADVNAASVGSHTALMYAVCSLQLDLNCPRILLEAGALINACNIYGVTALIEAALGAIVEMVALVLLHGSLINHENCEGQNALTIHLCERSRVTMRLMMKL